MWEAVVLLCLAAGAPCREVLIPGREAAGEGACLAGLAMPPVAAGEVAKGAPFCREAPAPLAFEEVAPGVFVHGGRIEELSRENAGDIANIGFVIGRTSAAVIDAGGSRAVGEGVWRAIRTRTALPVSHVILTHMHPDHILGASVFTEVGAKVAGHAALARALTDRGAFYLDSIGRQVGLAPLIGGGVPAVDISVAETTEIDLGGRVLELRAWPTAHSETDLTVLDRQTGTLFAGDLLFQGHVPVLDGSLRGWEKVLETLAATPVSRVVPGHGRVVARWPVALEEERRYLTRLGADIAKAIADGVRIGPATEAAAGSEAGRWQLFDAYNARNATSAYGELEWE